MNKEKNAEKPAPLSTPTRTETPGEHGATIAATAAQTSPKIIKNRASPLIGVSHQRRAVDSDFVAELADFGVVHHEDGLVFAQFGLTGDKEGSSS